MISGLETERKKLEAEQAEVEEKLKELEKRETVLAKKEREFTEKKQHALSESSEEARRILQEAKDYADKTISWYSKHGGNSREMEKRRTELRGKMGELESNIRTVSSTESQKSGLKAGDLKIGDAVRVLSLGLNGTVSTLPDAKGWLFVTLGIMRTKVRLDDLILLDEVEIRSDKLNRTSSGKVRMNKSLSVSPEINLLGKTVDEACAELDKYLDDAALAHLEQVRIVHGKGTGALRNGVHKYLKKNRHVASFRLGEFGEGDAGVTIAKLK